MKLLTGYLASLTDISVWLVISSHRNDDEVMQILTLVHESASKTFDRILIVDSEGIGALPTLIRERGWQDVDYRCYGQNLGSGGNLCERLRLAAEGGADYAYAINHDGNFDKETYSKLIDAAASISNVGAVYPLSFFTSAGRYNLTGTRELPLPAKLVSKRPEASLIDVFWSSSNGALYSLTPAKKGILPWPIMWMAWEDLEYGWRLTANGYRQVIVCDAIYQDNYEYAQSWLGNTVDKPAWRTYYNARNLILAVRRSRNTPLFYAAVCYRLLRELALIVLAKNAKLERLGCLFRGTFDAWRTKIDRSDNFPRGAGKFQEATPTPR